jgi:hypothetical protein
MNKLLSSLVACSLLANAAFGCCHAHQASCDEAPLAALCDDAVCLFHDCCGDHPKQHGQPEHAPCKCPMHCQGVCTYLPVEKTQVDSRLTHVLIDLAAIVPAAMPSGFTNPPQSRRSGSISSIKSS